MKRAVNTAEAARITGISYDTLASWRSHGKGPRFLKMGDLVRYRPEDLEAFMLSRTMSALEAAEFTGVCENTLKHWRSEGKGPCFLKVDGLVRYRLEELSAFMLSSTMSTREAAEFTGVCENTLKGWRSEGKGPRFFKIGGLARYRPEDLEAFMDARLVDPADPKEKP